VRKILSMALALAMVFGAASAVWAQPAAAQPAAGSALKPLVTISFSGYDELLGDIKFLGQLAGQPELSQMAEGFIQQATQGKGLAGIDQARPWGAVVQTDGGMGFPFYIFVPVSDLKATLELLADSGMESEDIGNGMFQIATPLPAFVKEQDGWAFIGQTPDALANVPSDPTKALGQLPQDYDIAVRASLQNIPAPFRQMAIGQLKAGEQMGSQPMPGEDADQFAIRSGMAKQAIQQFVTLFEDLDTLLVGLNINQETSSVYLDVEFTAVPGSNTAAQFAQLTPGKTNFAGFDLPGAAVTANFAGKLSDADVTQATAMIAEIRSRATEELGNQGLSEEKLALASGLLNDLLDVAQANIDNRTSDGGMVVMLKADSLSGAAGGAVVDGDKLENVVKKLIGAIQKDDPNVAQLIQLDAETHADVRFHKFVIPVPEEDAKQFLGETLEIVLGVNNESLFVAGGKDATGLLKQIIDKSNAEAGKEIPPARIAIAATPIAEFIAAAAEKNDPGTAQMAGMVAQMLSQHAGKDHLLIVVEPVENGNRVRIELEQGILAVIPALGMQATMGGGGAEERPAADASPF
jgi:hypothetical protein